MKKICWEIFFKLFVKIVGFIEVMFEKRNLLLKNCESKKNIFRVHRKDIFMSFCVIFHKNWSQLLDKKFFIENWNIFLKKYFQYHEPNTAFEFLNVLTTPQDTN